MILRILILCVFSAVTSAQIHVRAFAPDGGDGTSWQTAYNDLQIALADAAMRPPPVEIWVAIGFYAPDEVDTARSFALIDGVHLYGGFVGNETRLEDRNPDVNPTFLSGDLAGDDSNNFVNYDDNARHVVTAENVTDATLDGFIVYAGAAGLDGLPGAGLLIDGATPTIANCFFTRNLGQSGAGIAAIESPLTISSCTFGMNRAHDDGGGIASLGGDARIIDCTFHDNEAARGAGAAVIDANLALIGSSFSDNDAEERGGGAYHEASGQATLTVNGCTFDFNDAVSIATDTYGGGLCVAGPDIVAMVESTTFTGNHTRGGGITAGRGGGMAAIAGTDATVFDCTFIENDAETAGGGLFVDARLTLDASDFTGNFTTALDGGGLYVDSDDDIFVVSSTFTGNQGKRDGGAIHIQTAASVLIEACHFEANEAALDGAGLFVQDDIELDVLVTGCTFHANVAKHGGGVRSLGSYVHVDECLFTENVGTESSAGVRLLDGDVDSTHLLTNSTFIGNTSTGSGPAGGVHGFVDNCHIEANTSGSGGALFVRGVCQGSTFLNNDGWRGGGCNIEGTLRDSILIGNSAILGGAINMGGETAGVVNCLIAGNHATEAGGVAVCIAFSSTEATFVNSLMIGNTAVDTGGAFRLVDRIDLRLINCTLAYNHADDGATVSIFKPQASFEAVNSIVWMNDVDGDVSESTLFEFENNESVPLFDHCIVQGWSGRFDGEGTTALDPLFVDPAGEDGIIGTPDDDFRLAAGSPAIDAGTDPGPDEFDADADGDTRETLPIDLDGNARDHDDPGTPDADTTVDCGAYEFQGVSCYADCNLDGSLDILDFVCFQNRFTNGHPKADCDGSGVFDMLDFMCYSDAFMNGCP